ncbi:AAEL001408-PA, partial [Aedes aegypti]
NKPPRRSPDNKTCPSLQILQLLGLKLTVYPASNIRLTEITFTANPGTYKTSFNFTSTLLPLTSNPENVLVQTAFTCSTLPSARTTSSQCGIMFFSCAVDPVIWFVLPLSINHPFELSEALIFVVKQTLRLLLSRPEFDDSPPSILGLLSASPLLTAYNFGQSRRKCPSS